MHTLGLRVAEKLALAGIKINLIELRSCEFRQKLTLAGIKKSGIKEPTVCVVEVDLRSISTSGVYNAHWPGHRPPPAPLHSTTHMARSAPFGTRWERGA